MGLSPSRAEAGSGRCERALHTISGLQLGRTALISKGEGRIIYFKHPFCGLKTHLERLSLPLLEPQVLGERENLAKY